MWMRVAEPLSVNLFTVGLESVHRDALRQCWVIGFLSAELLCIYA